MGAALSYYALFSLFPTVLVILSVVGFLLGPNTDLVSQILEYARGSLPDSAYAIVQETLFNLNQSSVGAGIVGFFLLLFAASNVFGALDRAVDRIWEVYASQRTSASFKAAVLTFLKNRVLAFTLVLSSAALLLLSLSANLVFKILQQILQEFNQTITFIQLDEVTILKNVQIGVTFFILNLIVMVLFKLLPSTRVHWGDIWLGSLVTTGLFTALQNLVSNSVIHISSRYSSYGLVGGVMVLLLWIFLTCQVFFIGTEVTYVYAHLFGSRRHQAHRLTSPPHSPR